MESSGGGNNGSVVSVERGGARGRVKGSVVESKRLGRCVRESETNGSSSRCVFSGGFVEGLTCASKGSAEPGRRGLSDGVKVVGGVDTGDGVAKEGEAAIRPARMLEFKRFQISWAFTADGAMGATSGAMRAAMARSRGSMRKSWEIAVLSLWMSP